MVATGGSMLLITGEQTTKKSAVWEELQSAGAGFLIATDLTRKASVEVPPKAPGVAKSMASVNSHHRSMMVLVSL